MSFRFGLRGRMALSYVLVSAAAVLAVEAALLAVMIPRMRAADDGIAWAQQREVLTANANLRMKTEVAALELAKAIGDNASRLDAGTGQRPDPASLLSTAAGQHYAAMGATKPDAGQTRTATEVVAARDGRIVVSNSTDLPPGSLLPAEAIGEPHSGTTEINEQTAGWATQAVELTGNPGDPRRVVGLVYVRAVGQARPPLAAGIDSEVTSLVFAGLKVLVLLLPVGALFGLLSTGRIIRRVRRLAAGATAMADGDLKVRIPVSSDDELGRLERAFNSMAQRLDAAVEVERKIAGADARRGERARITRELHDSISQDLFSANLLAGGLRKALPPDSRLRQQAVAMEQSLGRTMREMRAMLLELRPIALEDAGLAEALTELCRAYETRLGILITVEIDPMRLEPALENAVLRMAQEALGNAARHGDPATIDLRVVVADGVVMVTVHDDGKGFDPSTSGRRHGMGLGLMRERAGELGGTLEVFSAPERGTTVKVLLPAGAA